MEELLNKIDLDGFTWQEAYLESVRFFESQRDYLTNLFTHTSGLDAFIEHMTA